MRGRSLSHRNFSASAFANVFQAKAAKAKSELPSEEVPQVEGGVEDPEVAKNLAPSGSVFVKHRFSF